MKIREYSIYDTKAEAFDRKVGFRSDQEAIRAFGTQCTNQETLVGMYPQDYALYLTSIFSQETGVTVAETAPIQIITGLEAAQIAKKELNSNDNS